MDIEKLVLIGIVLCFAIIVCISLGALIWILIHSQQSSASALLLLAY